MSNLKLTKTGDDTGEITVSVCKLGDYITAGNSSIQKFTIVDGDRVRKLAGDLFNLKRMNFNGLVEIKLSDTSKLSMDQSIWPDFADALFAFTFCQDVAKLEA